MMLYNALWTPKEKTWLDCVLILTYLTWHILCCVIDFNFFAMRILLPCHSIVLQIYHILNVTNRPERKRSFHAWGRGIVENLNCKCGHVAVMNIEYWKSKSVRLLYSPQQARSFRRKPLPLNYLNLFPASSKITLLPFVKKIPLYPRRFKGMMKCWADLMLTISRTMVWK